MMPVDCGCIRANNLVVTPYALNFALNVKMMRCPIPLYSLY